MIIKLKWHYKNNQYVIIKTGQINAGTVEKYKNKVRCVGYNMFMVKLVLYLENDIVPHKLDEGE